MQSRASARVLISGLRLQASRVRQVTLRKLLVTFDVLLPLLVRIPVLRRLSFQAYSNVHSLLRVLDSTIQILSLERICPGKGQQPIQVFGIDFDQFLTGLDDL